MGWKRVKDHYGIRHIVHMLNGGLTVGSEYCPDLIQIKPSGEVIVSNIVDTKGTLGKLVTTLRSDPELLRGLIAEPDQFDISIPVFSVVDGVLIEQMAESLEWPSVTHDGELMYQNTHFPSAEAALKEAKDDLERSVGYLDEQVINLLAQIEEIKSRSAKCRALADRVSEQLQQIEEKD